MNIQAIDPPAQAKAIRFFVAGMPIAQPRPRAFARKFGDKWQARVYDAGTAEGWKSLIAEAARPHLPAIPIEGPVKLEITFCMPRPKSHFLRDKVRPMAPFFHVCKPDLDNLEKAVKDCLTQIGMWRDDSQVAQKITNKSYGGIPGYDVGAEIRVTRL